MRRLLYINFIIMCATNLYAQPVMDEQIDVDDQIKVKPVARQSDLTIEQKKELVHKIINQKFEFEGIPDHITSKFKEDYLKRISAELFTILLEHFPDSGDYEHALRHVSLYYFEEGDYEKAKSYLEEYLSLKGTNKKTIQMRFYLGVAYKELKMYKKAIKSFFKVIDTLGENDLSYEAYLNIADCYERQNNTKKLIMTYENVAGYFNDTRIISSSLLKVSKIFIEQNNYFSAIWNLKRVTERYMHTEYYYEALYILARCYAQTGEINKQREILKQVAGDHSMDNRFAYKALYALADSYYLKEEYKEASIAYFTALKSDPRYKKAQEARYRLAQCYLKLGINDLAQKAFEELIEKELPPNRKQEVLFALGKIYFINSEYEKAIETLMSITHPGGNELYVNYYLGMSFFELEEYRPSFEQFLFLEHQDNNMVLKVRGIIMLGTILLNLNKFDSATHYFDTSIEIIDSLTRIETTEYSEEDKSSQLSNEEVAELNEMKTKALFALGRGYFTEKRYEKAAEVYQSLMPLEISPADRAWVLYQIGKCYENAQDYERARQMYTELREKYPDYHVAEQAAWDLKNIEWNNRYSKIKNM